MGAQRAVTSAARRALDGPAAVVVFIAPAGHGKTTTLDVAAEAAADRAVVRVDAGRPDAVATLTGAVGTDAVVLVEGLHRLAAAGGPASPGDDGGGATGGCGPDELATLLVDLATGGARVVIATRSWPNLPLRRWQVAGIADVVTAERLLLDRAEVGHRLGLRGDALDRAVAATGGWPSAVALLALRLGDGPLDQALAAARQDHVAYVHDEALDVLDDDERRLLAAASVFERLDPRLVETVTGDPTARAGLRAIAQRTQLLVADGDDFVWHPDVRAAVALDLAAGDPTARRDLHLAAAAVLGRDHRNARARLHHLVEAEAWEEGLALVAEAWPNMLTPQDADTLVHAIEGMPSDHVAHDPVYALGTGAVLLVNGQAHQAAAFLDLPGVREDPAARATAHALRAHATWWAVSPDRALDHVARATALLDEDPDLTLVPVPGFEPMTTGRTMLDVSRARALALRGDVEAARQILAALPDVPSDDPASESVSAWATKALVDALAGHLPAAAGAADTAFALAASGGWLGAPAVAAAHLGRALVATRAGARGDVGPDIEAAAAAAVSTSAWGLLRTTYAVAAMCGLEDRPLTLATAEVPAPVPLAHNLEGAWRARAALRHGDALEAAALLALVEPTELALGPWVEVALATGDRAHVAATVAALGPPTTTAGSVVRLLADAAVAGPDERAALAVDAVAAVRLSGLIGVLAEAPQEVWPTLGGLELDGATLAPLAERASRTGGPGELSDRELQVLALLDGPLSVKEIGRELYLSGHTVKWYVARLYRKLGVHTRAEAVSRARQLGLC